MILFADFCVITNRKISLASPSAIQLFYTSEMRHSFYAINVVVCYLACNSSPVFCSFLSSVIVLVILLCRIQMPQTYVVHLGNSKELMEVAEDSVARRVLREHIRESLGVRNDDLLFAIINSKLPFLR